MAASESTGDRHSLSEHFADTSADPRHRSPGYSKFVNGMKMLLLALTAALVVTVIGWTSGDNEGSGLPFSFTNIRGLGTDNQTMVNPKYAGTDSRGNPFLLTADLAIQDKHNQRLVSLASLRAEITATDGNELVATAGRGLFNQEKMTLELLAPVELRSANGYQMKTDGAKVDLKKGTVRSTAPVQGKGPLGQISADRMWLADKGNRLYFDGHVRLIISNTEKAAK